MKYVSKMLSGLLNDDRGGEVIEYALIIGLIVVASLGVIGLLGGKVLAKWQSTDSAL